MQFFFNPHHIEIVKILQKKKRQPLLFHSLTKLYYYKFISIFYLMNVLG